MLHRILFGLLTISCISFFTINGSAKSFVPIQETVDKYTLTFDKSKPKVIQVEAQINLQDSLLHMSANGPVPNWWPQYIQNLIIQDENGNSLPLQERDSTAWILEDVPQGTIINLQYEVKLNHEDRNWPGGIDGVAFVRDWGIMASGRSLFIINGAEEKKIKIFFETSEDWKVSVPWKPNGANNYTIPNHTQLLESLMFVGTHRETQIRRDGFTLNFVLGGAFLIRFL